MVRASVMRGLARAALARPALGWLTRRRRSADAELDPQIAGVLELQRLMKMPALETLPIDKARRFSERNLGLLDVAVVSMARVIDTAIGAVPVRIYEPHEATDHGIVYLHGGGGVIGSIRGCDPFCRLLAAQTRSTVASVEYRLGPEHKHPAAIEDAIAAFDGLRGRFAGRAAIAGDSFGGYLSAFVARDAKRRPDLQVLIYPGVDMTLTSPSIARLADGYLLTRSMMTWFRDLYFKPEDDRRAASPKYWPDLRGLPPAIVVTAGFDPLVDDGDAFAEALQAAGVPVVHRRYPALIHGFLSFGGAVRAARAAIDTLSEDIAAGLAT